jgi:hypothetical protein
MLAAKNTPLLALLVFLAFLVINCGDFVVQKSGNADSCLLSLLFLAEYFVHTQKRYWNFENCFF